jgi:peptide deformylase
MGIILPKQAGTEEGRLLFQKSEKVEDFDQGREIVDSLKKTLEHYGGVGLAAPQIGISRRVFIVNIIPTKDDPQLSKIGFRAYLNPEILAVSSEVNSDSEGCLSIFYATLYGWVERPSWVRLKYQDIKGEEQIEEIDYPFHTRVILHENDHLDGKVFLQRMKEEDFSKLYWEENLDIRKINSE